MADKCCDITVGQMKVPATIERKVRTANGSGGYTETWTADPGRIWVSVQMLTGTESWQAMRVHPGNLMRVRTRFRGDANGAPYWSATAHRITIRGRIYGILAVVDVEMAQRWIAMDVLEGKVS